MMGPASLIPPLLVVAVLLGLMVARTATFALFRLVLPVVLTLLSVVLGSRLRRAARTCDELGIRGQRVLLQAARRVREHADAAAATRHAEQTRAPRTTAEPQPRPRVRRVRVVDEEPVEDEHDDESAQNHTGRASRE